MQIALIGTLLIFNLLFRFWPVSYSEDGDLSGKFNERELAIQEFIITTRPSPIERPAPAVPRQAPSVPTEEIVDMEFDLEIEGLESDFGLAPFPMESRSTEIVENPDRPANVRRIVEPVMPPQARRDGVRIEIEVRYVVSERGDVEEVEIEMMRIYNRETGMFVPVKETGYGFREITLRAARQWVFQPAEYQGMPVRSVVRHRFTFGSS